MNNTSERQRLESLFSDLERLNADPASDSPEIKQRIDGLRSRLSELEKQVPVGNAQNHPPHHAIVYEKDQVGYVYSNNKLEPLNGSGRSLPKKNDVVKSSMTINGEVVGEMQVVSPNDRQLTADEVALANAVSQQASLQIQNLRLLAAAERSRTEAETATRRFIHEGWDSYLDAIQQKERVGYVYDQSSVTPYHDALRINGGVQAKLKVMDEQVGILYVEQDHNNPLTDSEKQLVSAVADQVAQQVENIRLLADAARARANAEEAIHRLTRENWQNYLEDQDETELGFVYDNLQVRPLGEVNLPQDHVLSQPLTVSGESIGQLTVAGMKEVPADALGMVSAIAAQASIHLETLRLNEELKKRAFELEELDRLKSSFLANMSHELRTPLNSILGFTDVMLEGLDGDLTEYMNSDLRRIQKNGQHLLHLINDVLDMAKIESGRMNLHPETFKIHDVMDDVNSITSTLASEKNLSLYIADESDREMEIHADITRIRQVMINLVNNSIKFTEQGEIVICAKNIEDDRVLISVKDTGLGIPEEKLESIFQEFTQVDSSATRKVGGTGLGLPISRRLIEMHGGRLWAESTGIEGQGSTFFVEMPIQARITEVIERRMK